MESRYDIDAKIGSGVRNEHALIPIDLQVDLNIKPHDSYTVKEKKMTIEFIYFERDVHLLLCKTDFSFSLFGFLQ